MQNPAAWMPRITVASLLAVTLAVTGCKKGEEAPAEADPSTEPAPEAAIAAPKTDPSITVDLSRKWPAGKQFIVLSEVFFDNEIQNPAVPEPIKQSTLVSREFSLTVTGDRPGGGQELAMEILKEKFVMANAGRTSIAFDSQADAKFDRQNPIGPAMRKVIGSKLKYLTRADGEIDSVEGATDITTKALRTLPPQLAPLITPMYSAEVFKKVPALHATLPGRTVQQGETWNTTEKMGPTELTITDTFKGFETRNNVQVAMIEQTGSLGGAGAPGAAPAPGVAAPPAPSGIAAPPDAGGAAPPTPPAENPNPDDASMQAQGAPANSLTGKLYFDPKLGVIVESESNAQISAQIPLRTGQTMNRTSKIKSTLKVLEVRDAAPAAAAPAAK